MEQEIILKEDEVKELRYIASGANEIAEHRRELLDEVIDDYRRAVWKYAKADSVASRPENKWNATTHGDRGRTRAAFRAAENKMQNLLADTISAAEAAAVANERKEVAERELFELRERAKRIEENL